MKAFVYRNTKSDIPGWASVHEKQPRGMAYETDRLFVHIYGAAEGLWTISNGLTVTKQKDGELSEWVTQVFGAENIEQSEHDVGITVEGVWRPGLYYDKDMLQALAETDADLRISEQSLLLLIERLDELLLFVEPTPRSLGTYSHKARELLILACTEAEAQWRRYLQRAGLVSPKKGFTMNDYVRLRGPLRLEEYEVTMPRYDNIPPARPFSQWSAAPPGPTQTLSWYDAYNKTKHDKKSQFSAATVTSCIKAIAANIVLFCVRFGPYRLYQGGGMLSAMFNPMFAVALRGCDPKSFYIPEVDIARRTDTLTWGHAEVLPWKPTPFKL